MGMARVIDTDEVGAWRYDCSVYGSSSRVRTSRLRQSITTALSVRLGRLPQRWARAHSASERPLGTAP